MEVLKNLPDGNTEDMIGRKLDASLIKLLQENRGQKDAPKQPRGRKINPGGQITSKDLSLPGSDCAGPPGIQQQARSCDDNKCSVCNVLYDNYKGPEWLQCVYCLAWVCGRCTGGVYDGAYSCPDCD
ncbi:hypothetical protein HOLleu_19061 [Holothuria leucospilota]|uniref:Uncharacterized protein n=1 Tax=Holothuria leucospilota TaxID=206669 RepID=A0A9Q1H9X1_HOLLE|nr:hypothetical protein HOLleu_19061 [Holothuria leucospilota]